MSTPVDKDACDLLDADHLAVKHLFVEYARLAFAGGPIGATLIGKKAPWPARWRNKKARANWFFADRRGP